MPMFHFLSFLLLLLLLANSSYGCVEEERQALLKFKRSLDINSSSLSTSWKGTDCCTWTGVECDATIGHVVTLSYDGSYDNGVFTPKGDVEWISNLTSLQNLTLVYLDLSGARNLFKVLTMLPYLSVLSLSDCGLNNTHISPAQINFTTSISRIQHLDLGYNQFVGPFPSFLQNMTSLTYLDLSYDYFNFSVPYWLGNLKNIQLLYLRGNSFDRIEGGMSGMLGNLCSLKSLDLIGNRFNNESLDHTYMNVSGCDGYALEELDLSRNNFKCQIPDWLMSFKNLTSLALSYNSFYGPIPASIQSLSNLEELHLDYNKLNGPIPTSIGKLSNLEELHLGDNNLNGSIPTSIGKLSRLRTLYLDSNELSGVVPESLGQLVDLEVISLSYNSLEGFLTEIHLTNLSKLKYFRIGSNSNLIVKVKSGWVPSFQLESMSMISCKLMTEFPEWIESQVHLEELDLSNCSISGPISDSLMAFENLTHLYLENNAFNGSIPATLGKLSRLTYLILTSNQLSGVVPESLGQLVDLKYLDLSFNSLQGFLTEVHFTNLSLMTYFYINSNNLSVKVKPDWVPPFQLQQIGIGSSKSLTEFPRWLETQKDLQVLDLSNCSISELIPDWLQNTMPYLAKLRLSHNLINGSIPFTFCNMTRLQFLDLSGNLLSGDIPNCWQDFQSPDQLPLSTIKLSSNTLTGVIPSSLGRLSGLSSLHLNNNSLQGEIPLSLRNCTKLVVLDLGENRLYGNIPHWIGHSLLQLVILRFRNNRLVGAVPSQLCQLPSLKILDIAENNLSNTVPRCLGNLSGMISSQTFSKSYSELSLETVSIVIQGRIMEYSTVLRFLVTMDLSNNRLGGMIPEELTNLNGLHGLNFSYNHLMGNIPKNIGNMKSLASLDLSRNQLSGSIPASLSNLYSLSHLNMSYNNLSGQIPIGSQLQTLNDDPSIYVGNPELCGAPVFKKCTVDKLPSTDDEDNDEDDKFENIYFYIIVTLGYATGLWGVIGVLIFKKKWRYAYFRFADETKDSIYVAVVLKTAYLKRKMGLNHDTM